MQYLFSPPSMFRCDAIKPPESIEKQIITMIFPGFALDVIFYSCQLNRRNLKLLLVTLGDKSIASSSTPRTSTIST